jgi:glutamate synthase (NADPH/NADH) large chain
MASEVGTLDIPTERIVRKGRLQPGRMFLIDTDAGRIIEDSEIKAQLAAAHPYQRWLDDGLIDLDGPAGQAALHRAGPRHAARPAGVRLHPRGDPHPVDPDGPRRQGGPGLDGHRHADRRAVRPAPTALRLLHPAVRPGDQPAARRHPRGAGDQPGQGVRARGQPLGPGPGRRRARSSCPTRCSTTTSCASCATWTTPGPTASRAGCCTPTSAVAAGGAGLAADLERLRSEVSAAIEEGVNVVILSDRFSTEDRAPIPIAVGHLGGAPPPGPRTKARTRVGLIVESGECREVHHFATLIGYGAAAVNPYPPSTRSRTWSPKVAWATSASSKAVANYVQGRGQGRPQGDVEDGHLDGGVLRGAQIFEAIGPGHELVDEYFTGTVSRLGGIGLDEIAEEVRRVTRSPARPARASWPTELEVGGEYQWRREGEYHLFNPRPCSSCSTHPVGALRRSSRSTPTLVDDQARPAGHPARPVRPSTPPPARRCRSTRSSRSRDRQALLTGAMSYGSISAEAHETLAIAMNRLGGKSNTGEGGEEPTASRPTPTATRGAARSSRWPPAASA